MADPSSPIVKEFLIESFENLSNLSDEFTTYEKHPEDKELLNSIYRKIHTIKGSASFLGFIKLQSVTHSAENILDFVREGKLTITPDLVDVFLETFDCAHEIVKFIENTGEEGTKDYSTLVAKLLEVLEKVSLADEVTPGSSSSVDSSLLNQDASESMTSPSNLVKSSPEHDAINPFDTLEAVKVVEKAATNIIASASAPVVEESVAPVDAKVEEIPTASKSATLTDSVVRVNVQLLDKIMNVVGELVLNRNQILQYANTTDSSELTKLAQQLNVITTELQTDIMTTRMQPVGSVLSKFERIVRDLARGQKKKIKLTISGKDTELDKTLLEAIRDPLTHLIRNSVDHGVEDPENRKEKGKPEEGTIQIKAYHEGGQVTIEIKDDGNGINPAVILEKAIGKGLVSQEKGENLSQKQILKLIFTPGFSTAEQVTSISGRGVGMDVVKSNIEKIGGSVDISSAVGEGTSFKLKIPLTLAIVPALVVRSAEETFAIPQINLVELVRLEGDEQNQLEKLHNSEFLRLRGELVPIFRLNETLKIVNQKEVELEISSDEDIEVEQPVYDTDKDSTNIVVLNAEGRVYGLIVDSVLDTEEIVVKPLSRKLKDLSVFAGATIMGDGRVSLIVDALGFFNMVDNGQTRKGDDVVDDENKYLFDESQEVLLCDLGDDRPYAIPLCLVNRLEEFKVANIEWSGEQPLIRYGKVAMPLINIEKTIKIEGVSPLGHLGDMTDGVVSCVVVLIRGTHFGLVVQSIRDIAVCEGEINEDTVDRDGFLGTVFVNDKTVTLLDVHGVLECQHIGSQRSKALESGNGKILIVDDSPLHRRIQSEYLKENGFLVVIANDGREAIEKMSSESNVDIILTDKEMPNMNGFEMAQAIRSSGKAYANIPIIGMTTNVSKMDVDEGKKVGVETFLEKQNQDEVISTLKMIVNG